MCCSEILCECVRKLNHLTHRQSQNKKGTFALLIEMIKGRVMPWREGVEYTFREKIVGIPKACLTSLLGLKGPKLYTKTVRTSAAP